MKRLFLLIFLLLAVSAFAAVNTTLVSGVGATVAVITTGIQVNGSPR